MASRTTGEDGRQDRVEGLIDFVAPAVEDILRRLDPTETDEFTTLEFIEVLRSDPAGGAAYDEAVRRWGESEHYAKLVVHGQVIPLALRRSGLVEWLGYAHGEDDPYGVPARWQLIGGRRQAVGGRG